MANSNDQSRFQCPRCLAHIAAAADQAGCRVSCPGCGIALTVPVSIGNDALFDDLFDEPASKKRGKPGQSSLPLAAEVPANAADKPRPGQIDEPEATRAEESDDPPDPFEPQELGPLRIEGISDEVTAADAFYFSCPVCESKIQALESQMGDTVRCADCHSQVKIQKPPPSASRPDPWRQAAKLKQEAIADSEFTLAPAVERPQSTPPLADGYGLEEVQADLLLPATEPAEEASGDAKPPRWKKQPGQRAQVVPRTLRRKKTLRKPSMQPTSQVSRKLPRQPLAEKGGTTREPDGRGNSWNDLLPRLRTGLLKDVDLVIRSVITVIFLTFSDAMSDYVWATLSQEDLNGGEAFVELFPALLGSVVCLVVAVWLLAITFSVVMSSFANGQYRVEEWVGFSPSEWVGSLAVVAVAAWAALLPGVLLGFVLWKVTGWFVFLPLLAAVSLFTLLPLFMISSFYNESAVNIYATDIFESVAAQGDRWRGAYKMIFAGCLVFLFGMMLAWIPGLIFSFIGAAVQTLAITLLAVVIGRHANHVIRAIQAGSPG